MENFIIDASKTILNTQDVMYTLYFMYNTFYLAVIYHEIKRELNKDNYDCLKEKSNKLMKDMKYDEYYKIFPEHFTSLLTDINSIFHFENSQNKTEAQTIFRQKSLEIEETFSAYEFVITYEGNRRTHRVQSIRFSNFYLSLSGEIRKNVVEFNYIFNKLYM